MRTDLPDDVPFARFAQMLAKLRRDAIRALSAMPVHAVDGPMSMEESDYSEWVGNARVVGDLALDGDELHGMAVIVGGDLMDQPRLQATIVAALLKRMMETDPVASDEWAWFLERVRDACQFPLVWAAMDKEQRVAAWQALVVCSVGAAQWPEVSELCTEALSSFGELHPRNNDVL